MTTYCCSISQTNLVDFTNCARPSGVRDITDWPADDRDGYQMTDIGNAINAYFVACMKARPRANPAPAP